MIRFLSLLLFFYLQAFANDEGLARANKWLGQKNTKSILNAYHEFKNLRINAIMQDDDSLHLKAVEGIVKAGRLLHINIEKYRKELIKLGGKIIPKLEDKKPEKSSKVSVNYLKSARWRSGYIVLSFSSSVKENQINYFVLDKKFNRNYRYIFDISAKANRYIKLEKKNLKAIRINSSNKNRVRIVLENSSSLPLKYSRRGRELIISLGGKTVAKDKVDHSSYRKYTKKKKVVVIDAGHGGRDAGAVGYKRYREKIIVFQISKRFRRELEKLGYKVYMTRDRDKYIKLRKRTAFANYKKADLFISIHANSVPKRGRYKRHHGIETYYLSTASSTRAKKVAATENSKDIETMNYFAKESFLGLLNSQKIVASNKLAIDLQRGMLGILKKHYSYVRDAGVKKGPFWVLVGAQMPAVLVEVGFVTSPKEARYLVNEKYQQRLALGLALGVKNYFKNNP
jgi:N-acetylmuramoyl-L-alanine amidase